MIISGIVLKYDGLTDIIGKALNAEKNGHGALVLGQEKNDSSILIIRYHNLKAHSQHIG